MPFDALVAAAQQRLGADAVSSSQFRDNRRLHVAPHRLLDLLRLLKEEHGFDMLAELTAVDYLKYPNASDRFGVIYVLLNNTTGERVIVKTVVNEPEIMLPSAFALWKGADWMEREVFDMFGIVFDGHPDLKRILLPDGWQGHPLRKDYNILQQDTEWVKINLGIESGQ